jgi:hypothetical protein
MIRSPGYHHFLPQKPSCFSTAPALSFLRPRTPQHNSAQPWNATRRSSDSQGDGSDGSGVAAEGEAKVAGRWYLQ